jgi:hypothetical protein
LIDSMDADEDACCVCVFVLLILLVLDETAPPRIDHGRCYARSDAACRLAVDQPWMDGRTELKLERKLCDEEVQWRPGQEARERCMQFIV